MLYFNNYYFIFFQKLTPKHNVNVSFQVHVNIEFEIDINNEEDYWKPCMRTYERNKMREKGGRDY